MSTVKTLLENPPEIFLQVSEILLKFANNILDDPTNQKYRKIRIGNPIVMEKLIPVDGAMDCLFAMGFQEQSDGEFLHLPIGESLDALQKLKAEIQVEREKKLGIHQERVRQTNTFPVVMPQNTTTGMVQMFANEMQFYQKLTSSFQHVLIYEDSSLQEKARQCIPIQELEKNAHKRLNNIKEASKEMELNELMIDVQDCFIIELAKWYRTEFFKWVDTPNCQSCNGTTRNIGMAEPTTDDRRWGAGRVENYLCDKCQVHTRFSRYNHPGKLLETRRGRCGEWANCFTLLCRACGYEARYVLDWTDHVWTEVFSQSQQRWVHSDTGENGYDKPLLYEAGWGKKLTYIIAFSCDDIQDVTWRYSAEHKEVLTRRNSVHEDWLVQTIIKLRIERQANISQSRKHVLQKRTIVELVEFLSEKRTIKAGEKVGRQTGSLAWRIARGEAGAQTIDSESFTFVPTTKEAQSKIFHVKYCCASDKYIRVSNDCEETEGWHKGVHEANNMFRKVETDWNMVYLARKEGSDNASVSWKFDFSASGLVVDTIEISVQSQHFENGTVSWRMCSGENCLLLDGSSKPMVTHHLQGSQTLMLTADLNGGQGDVAWQHTQLFRQDARSEDVYPMEIKITLK